MFKQIARKLKTIWWRIKSLGAMYYYDNPSSKLKVIGVTGNNGKTTTATLLYKITTALGFKAGLISTVENIVPTATAGQAGEKRGVTHTTPDSVSLTKLFKEMADRGCEYVFMEVSSHALDQNRVWGVNFIGGIFTNITHDHLDYHKSFENYFNAKKKFFEMLPVEAFALSNIDDEQGEAMLEGIKAKQYTYGFKHKADFSETLETQLIGDFNKYNALAVYAAARLLGMDEKKVKEILKTVLPPKGRFDYIKSSSGVTAIVDYAHTPDALQNVLETAQKIKENGARIISVFGCGGDRDPLKRRIMGKIGATLSDLAIFTSDNPRSENPDAIIAEMKTDLTPALAKKVKIMADRRQAIKEAVKMAQKGDIILCAGKGHEDYQEIKGVKHHFDDMEEFKKIFSTQT